MSKTLIPDFVQGDSVKIIIKTNPVRSLLGATFRLILKKNENSISVLDKVHVAEQIEDSEDNPGFGVVHINLNSDDTNIPDGTYIATLTITLDGKSSTIRSGKDEVLTVRCFKFLGD